MDRLLADAPEPGDTTPIALLAPHAGYSYSGPVAAAAYRTLRGRGIDTVVVVGTGHFHEVSGLALDTHGAFATPLGEVPVDKEVASALMASGAEIEISEAAHAREHSIETQLPFLQRVLGEFKLIPLLTNLDSPESAESLGRSLASALGPRKAVLVASSDLAHYPTAADARRIDPASLEAWLTLDAAFHFAASRLLGKSGAGGLSTAWCGAGAAAVVLRAAVERGADMGELIAYENSADQGGDPSKVVGYGGAMLARGGGERPWPVLDLSPDDQKELIKVVRDSLDAFLRARTRPRPRLFDRPKLNLPAAVFVTWRDRGGELKGCIGSCEASRSLGDAAAYFSVASATTDSRFQSITLEELSSLEAEVSVLSPMRPAVIADVEPGMGVEVSRGRRRGVLLPQVWERIRDRRQFLEILCSEKAGLPKECWNDPETVFRIFTSRSFCG